MKPNNFAMKDWHLEHVEKIIIRYIKGILLMRHLLKSVISKK
jgi:hypothetical protein